MLLILFLCRPFPNGLTRSFFFAEAAYLLRLRERDHHMVWCFGSKKTAWLKMRSSWHQSLKTAQSRTISAFLFYIHERTEALWYVSCHMLERLWRSSRLCSCCFWGFIDLREDSEPGICTVSLEKQIFALQLDFLWKAQLNPIKSSRSIIRSVQLWSLKLLYYRQNQKCVKNIYLTIKQQYQNI